MGPHQHPRGNPGGALPLPYISMRTVAGDAPRVRRPAQRGGRQGRGDTCRARHSGLLRGRDERVRPRVRGPAFEGLAQYDDREHASASHRGPKAGTHSTKTTRPATRRPRWMTQTRKRRGGRRGGRTLGWRARDSCVALAGGHGEADDAAVVLAELLPDATFWLHYRNP